MRDLLPYVFLLAAYGFGTFFGRSTNKPLWVGATIPAVVMSVIWFFSIASNERFSRWGELFGIVGVFVIGYSIIFGGIIYWVAKRARNIKNNIGVSSFTSPVTRKALYFIVVVIAISFAMEAWRKYHA
ncbi:MAG: hypothetical protein A2580_11335 [Hydrogenophilales bacterium RIFOXYD1_FULL_62_11]|nr:MAG: hypothetical protein A2580_11335 [Hydrogenophilales bacterium RIFOXYD1_FULL_62_11]